MAFTVELDAFEYDAHANSVELSGGHFCDSDKELRVNAVLEATRGLGNHGDPLLKACVITDPYTTSVKIDQHAQMLVLASRGVWEMFSPEEVMTILVQVVMQSQSACLNEISNWNLYDMYHAQLIFRVTSLVMFQIGIVVEDLLLILMGFFCLMIFAIFF